MRSSGGLAPNGNEKLTHPFRTRLDGTERDFLCANVEENRDKSTPFVKRPFFGTRGSQVQILPLRPVFQCRRHVRGTIWGTKPQSRSLLAHHLP